MLSEKKRHGSLAGRANAKATENYAARFALDFTHDFFRDLGMVGRPLRVSSLGLGTYLGECDDSDDARYVSSVRRAVEAGVNLLDTAINYRCQRSERAVGLALRDALAATTVKREEIVVCTKGGYIPLDSTLPASREAYQAHLKAAYFDQGIMEPADVVAGGHCLAPSYLADQIARSRANLGLQTIDVYYLHNPEQQLDAVNAGEFRNRIRAAFALLESECSSGRIGCYGCATWNGLRLTPSSRGHLSLADLVKIATEEGGSRHHFRVIQLPINLALTEAIRVPTQRLASGREVTLLEAARELRVSVIASGSLLQGKLSAGLPAQIIETIPGLATDAQRAIAFVRALPGVTAALVGMKSVAHLEENLGAVRAKAT